MAAKVYLVQAWKGGALTNHYEAVLSNARELKELKTYLEGLHDHVLITPVAKKRAR